MWCVGLATHHRSRSVGHKSGTVTYRSSETSSSVKFPNSFIRAEDSLRCVFTFVTHQLRRFKMENMDPLQTHNRKTSINARQGSENR